ncbi:MULTISPECIES: radical SAM protein [unclassified Rhizobacter]|uniref:radical SAM protein n=1 Tax=unclassified Rhizobacter TaxID=2640088 RepID=UPI0006FF9A59|nr:MULTISPECIES: radical SAM protein [unclassified Rhizobacter]KQU81248.1 hypothetical protein ASC88_13005 [Rhizobacter sp. Root29]KQW15401.1 hypothetical protein ASC98_14930 [Rhizobacter sp. Root1238]KRB12407.1 hypothetical protein ASE08_28805 [Rhizobacter sp. Root16D2]
METIGRVNLSGIRSRLRAREDPEHSVVIPRRLEVILKVAERCNIACTYCYFFDARNTDFERRPALISMETIEHVAAYLLNAARKHRLEVIQIDLHGGEPLLMKRERFDDMCSRLTRELQEVVDLRISLQTNGMLLDDLWIDLLGKHGVFVGVSLDGPQEVHDLRRVDHDSRGTYDRVIVGIKRLQARLPDRLGVIVVLNPETDGTVLYRHMVHDLGLKRLHIIAADETHDTAGVDGHQTVGDALCKIYEQWLQDNDSSIHIRFVGKSVRRILCGRDRLAEEEAVICDSLAITVDSDGHVGPDDDLRNALPHLFRGRYNVLDSTLNDFVCSSEIQALIGQIRRLPFQCADCCWKKVCRAGEVLGGPIQRYSSARAFDNPSVYCKQIQGLLEVVCESALRRGHAPASILENIA